jgi:uncharacterized repeat protein (TIGR01451 family)
MDGWITGWTRAALLLAGLGLVGDLPGAEPAPARAQPLLDVRQSMPDWVSPGEAVPIDIVVSNLGTAVAEAVTVRSTLATSLDVTDATPIPERLPGALLWTLGPLTPGQQRVLRLRVLPHPGVAVAEVRSSVQVTFQSSVGTTAAAQVRRPELELAVTGPDSALVGEAVTFQIVVRNRGSGPAQNVVLETLLPPGLSHPSGSDLENDIGTLGSGETRQIALRVTPAAAGELTQRLRLCAAGEAVVERQARLRAQDLKLRLVANGPRLLYDGWPASYELSLRNEGVEVVPQARLAAVLPPGLGFVGADASGVYAPATHSVSWELGDLRPGKERSVLWNGIARGNGDQECEATVTSGSRTCRRLSWKMTMVRAAPMPAPVPAAAPPRPDLSTPPPPLTPPVLQPAPPPATGDRAVTAPAVSAEIVAEGPVSEPLVWRRTRQPPQQGQPRSTVPAASP